MKHIVALCIKYVMTAVILEVVLMFMSTLSFSKILLISLAVTIIAYVIGDLLILSKSNNTTATICDAVISFITIYAFYYIPTFGSISITNSIVSAVVVAIGEWFFHKYMARSVFPDRDREHSRA